jgi:hypothetical protein
LVEAQRALNPRERPFRRRDATALRAIGIVTLVAIVIV